MQMTTTFGSRCIFRSASAITKKQNRTLDHRATKDGNEPRVTGAAPRVNVQYHVTPLCVRLQMEI